MTTIFKAGFILFFLCFSAKAKGQEIVNKSYKKNAAFVELGGNGFLNSINYDRLFTLKDSLIKASFRIGVGLYKTDESSGSSVVKVLPLEINFMLGRTKNYFEFGIGYTPSFGYRTYRKDSLIYATKNFDFNIVGRMGYRYQKPEGVIFFRIGATPIIYHDYFNDGRLKIAPWGGISAGISF